MNVTFSIVYTMLLVTQLNAIDASRKIFCNEYNTLKNILVLPYDFYSIQTYYFIIKIC